MFIPIGDSPNSPRTPWVTYGLMGINILVFLLFYSLAFRPASPTDPYAQAYVRVLAQERGVDATGAITAYDTFLFHHGFKPAHPRLADLLFSIFLHGGLLHIAGNMLFLWIYGDNVEDRLGPMAYLAGYLGTGVLAAGGDALLRFGSWIPSVGASGAISGVLGMYFLWFPRNRIKVWVFFFPFIATVIELPARIVLGIFVIIDNVLPLLFAGSRSGVAHGAHLGGFVAGLALAAIWNRWHLLRPEPAMRGAFATRDPLPPFRDTLAAHTATPTTCTLAAVFRTAIDEGRLSDAVRLLASLPKQRSTTELSIADLLALAQALEAAGHPRAALSIYQRALAEHPTEPGRASAHIGAARTLATHLNMPTAAYQHLFAALHEDPTPTEIQAARTLIEDLRRTTTSVPRRIHPLIDGP